VRTIIFDFHTYDHVVEVAEMVEDRAHDTAVRCDFSPKSKKKKEMKEA
jgi:hypothetical protein